MKKLLTLLMLLALSITLMFAFSGCGGTDDPVDTGSQGTTPNPDDITGELAFKLDTKTNTYIVTGIGTYTGKNIVIPSTYKNLPVTSIKDHAFYHNSSLESITIPNSITTIGDYAFSGVLFTNVTIPDSVISIGYYAFGGCYTLVEVYNLSSLNILAGSEDNGHIGAYAKVIHTSLEEESMLETANNYIFMKWEEKYYLIGYVGNDNELALPENYNGNNYEIYQYAFYKREDITKVIIPNCVTTIGRYAFYDCDSLTSVTIGDSLTSIGYSAFSGCSSLKSITIPDSVTSIKNDAFFNCRALTEINFNATAMNDLSNDNHVFADAGRAGNGIKVTIGKNVTKIPDFLLCPDSYYTSYSPMIISIEFEEGSVCESIGMAAFAHCTSLTSITIPNSVTSIGSDAFYGCYTLVEVYNLSSLNILAGSEDNGHIGAYAKVIHTSLEEESILETVNDYIFMTREDKYYLMGYVGEEKELILPDNYNGNNYEIYQYAFYERDDITKITVPYGVTAMGYKAFLGCKSLTSISIPNSVISIGYDAFDATFQHPKSQEVHISNLASWCNISFGNEKSNPLFYADSLYVNNELVTNLVIPDTVKEIKGYAFCGNSFTSITIPNSVTSIGGGAFSNCKLLKSVTIGDSVTSIGDGAFSDCKLLKSVTIGDSVTSIGGRAFSYCKSLTSVTIGNSVTSIGESAFYRTSLTSITIPNSVTSIGKSVFGECKLLKSLTFENTNEWYVRSYGAEGTNIDVTNPSTNATNLTDTYDTYYWYRSE